MVYGCRKSPESDIDVILSLSKDMVFIVFSYFDKLSMTNFSFSLETTK
jgi:hypothetical protein